MIQVKFHQMQNWERDGKTIIENIEVDKKILDAGHHHGLLTMTFGFFKSNRK